MSKKVYIYRHPPTKKQLAKAKRIANSLIITGVIFLVIPFIPVAYSEVWYFYTQITNKDIVLNSNDEYARGRDWADSSPFSRLLASPPTFIDPVSRDFGLVVEKIGLNAPVIADVSVTNSDAYNEALRNGVAHASISEYPSEEPGNVYLFAHASVNFWQLGRYASVFNLLRKLENGDNISVFYDGKEYVYQVVNKEVVKGFNTYPITRPVVEPTLTLQTCDPPGTVLNRLVVTSKLVNVR